MSLVFFTLYRSKEIHKSVKFSQTLFRLDFPFIFFPALHFFRAFYVYRVVYWRLKRKHINGMCCCRKMVYCIRVRRCALVGSVVATNSKIKAWAKNNKENAIYRNRETIIERQTHQFQLFCWMYACKSAPIEATNKTKCWTTAIKKKEEKLDGFCFVICLWICL